MTPAGKGMLAWLAMLAIVTLFPFDFSSPLSFRRHVLPAPALQDGEQMVFYGTGLAGSGRPAPGLVRAVHAAGSLRIDIEFATDAARQSGPARIVGLSRDTLFQNFMLGQDGAALVLRLASAPWMGERGWVHHVRQFVLTDDLPAGEWVRVRVLVGDGRIDARVGDRPVSLRLPEDVSFDFWRSDGLLVAGNETTGDRPWRGRIRRLFVGAGDRPAWFGFDPPDHPLPADWRAFADPLIGELPAPWRLVPFDTRHGGASPWRDWLANLLLFMPFGMLVRGLRRGLPAAVAGGLLISALVETAQLFLPGRYADITDILLNTLGALIGALIVSPRRGSAVS